MKRSGRLSRLFRRFASLSTNLPENVAWTPRAESYILDSDFLIKLQNAEMCSRDNESGRDVWPSKAKQSPTSDASVHLFDFTCLSCAWTDSRLQITVNSEKIMRRLGGIISWLPDVFRVVRASRYGFSFHHGTVRLITRQCCPRWIGLRCDTCIWICKYSALEIYRNVRR